MADLVQLVSQTLLTTLCKINGRLERKVNEFFVLQKWLIDMWTFHRTGVVNDTVIMWPLLSQLHRTITMQFFGNKGHHRL